MSIEEFYAEEYKKRFCLNIKKGKLFIKKSAIGIVLADFKWVFV